MSDLKTNFDIFHCPHTRQHLMKADKSLIGRLESLRKDNKLLKRSGRGIEYPITDGLVTEDERIFYIIDDGIPMLLGPEGISLHPSIAPLNTSLSQYWEPYEEMEGYNTISTVKLENEAPLTTKIPDKPTARRHRKSFPLPVDVWLDAVGGLMAQLSAYDYLNPLDNKVLLQIGGTGTHLIRFLLASNSVGYVLSPMKEELKLGRRLADSLGVGNRIFAVQGIAEELPFRDSTIDRVYSGGCMHHTRIEMSGPELHRILSHSGKASFVDPVLTLPYRLFVRPFYKRGIGRVDDAHCRPLYSWEIERFLTMFKSGKTLRFRTFCHFPLIMATRYLKLKIDIKRISQLERFDHSLAKLFPAIRKFFGPSICVCVEK